MSLDPGNLDRRVRFERPVAAVGFNGAGSGTWALVCEVWANVQDMLPSRGERIADGVNVSNRPARVRVRYRDGLTSTMRIVVGRNVKDADGHPQWQADRILQIVSGPAELGRRETMEFMAEEYRPAGNPA
jgi:head-tail adaptor